jgi:hypothetical protein
MRQKQYQKTIPPVNSFLHQFCTSFKATFCPTMTRVIEYGKQNEHRFYGLSRVRRSGPEGAYLQ